jgi:hypothetical protein
VTSVFVQINSRCGFPTIWKEYILSWSQKPTNWCIPEKEMLAASQKAKTNHSRDYNAFELCSSFLPLFFYGLYNSFYHKYKFMRIKQKRAKKNSIFQIPLQNDKYYKKERFLSGFTSTNNL